MTGLASARNRRSLLDERGRPAKQIGRDLCPTPPPLVGRICPAAIVEETAEVWCRTTDVPLGPRFGPVELYWRLDSRLSGESSPASPVVNLQGGAGDSVSCTRRRGISGRSLERARSYDLELMRCDNAQAMTACERVRDGERLRFTHLSRGPSSPARRPGVLTAPSWSMDRLPLSHGMRISSSIRVDTQAQSL